MRVRERVGDPGNSGGLKRVGNGDGCKQRLRIPNGTGLRAVSGQAPRAGQGLHCIRALLVFRDYRRKFWISDEEFWLNNEQGRIRSEPCFLDLVSSFCLKKKKIQKLSRLYRQSQIVAEQKYH